MKHNRNRPCVYKNWKYDKQDILKSLGKKAYSTW